MKKISSIGSGTGKTAAGWLDPVVPLQLALFSETPFRTLQTKELIIGQLILGNQIEQH